MVKYKSCTLFNRAIKKYGWENFEHTIIEENLTQEEANNKEQYYIQLYNSTDPEKGYNIRPGGSQTPISEETKKKISQSHMGIKPSEESRKKMSDWHKANPPNPEYLQKLLNANEARKKKVRCLNTDEVFNSIKEAQDYYDTGHTISDACKGKRYSSGHHPVTGEPLLWKYEEDYQKMLEVLEKYS